MGVSRHIAQVNCAGGPEGVGGGGGRRGVGCGRAGGGRGSVSSTGNPIVLNILSCIPVNNLWIEENVRRLSRCSNSRYCCSSRRWSSVLLLLLFLLLLFGMIATSGSCVKSSTSTLFLFLRRFVFWLGF